MRTAIPHILVVDDNESILESVAMVLRWNALRVTTLDKTDDFNHAVHVLYPDLVLLDKVLGWADGCDLCAGLKQDSTMEGIKVVMLSAFHNAKDDCLAAGADAFLEKPFDIDDLLQLVKVYTRAVLLPS